MEEWENPLHLGQVACILGKTEDDVFELIKAGKLMPSAMFDELNPVPVKMVKYAGTPPYGTNAKAVEAIDQELSGCFGVSGPGGRPLKWEKDVSKEFALIGHLDTEHDTDHAMIEVQQKWSIERSQLRVSISALESGLPDCFGGDGRRIKESRTRFDEIIDRQKKVHNDTVVHSMRRDERFRRYSAPLAEYGYPDFIDMLLTEIHDLDNWQGFSVKHNGIWLIPPEDERLNRLSAREKAARMRPFPGHDCKDPVLTFPCTYGGLLEFFSKTGLYEYLPLDNALYPATPGHIQPKPPQSSDSSPPLLLENNNQNHPMETEPPTTQPDNETARNGDAENVSTEAYQSERRHPFHIPKLVGGWVEEYAQKQQDEGAGLKEISEKLRGWFHDKRESGESDQLTAYRWRDKYKLYNWHLGLLFHPNVENNKVASLKSWGNKFSRVGKAEFEKIGSR